MVIHVVTGDPAEPAGLPTGCHLTGHDYLGPVTSPLGLADAIRLVTDSKPAGDRRPCVRRA